MRMTKNKKLVEEIFKPCNETFISEWKKWDELEDSKLTFKRGNGNSHRGGVWWGVNKYQWETEYVGGSVERIRIIGLSNKEKQGRPIRKEIRETLLKKYKGCIHCGNHKSLCIDHKNDMYNDKRVLCENLQKIEDFQVLCNKCNKDLKHQINVKEKKTGKNDH